MSALGTTTTPAGEVLPSAPVGRRPAGRRDRYIDTLRVVALVRVMTYHALGWAWLPLVFPSLGVMFALAGSLVAASLDRAPHGHYGVLRSRLRRVLPPVWALGLVLVPGMLLLGGGWDASGDVADVLDWRVLLWLLPVGMPPADAGGYDLVVPLWYIRSYIWFLVLSPALLWLFRRWPRRTLASFPLVVVAADLSLVDLFGRAGDTVLDAGVFGACWLLGFAHHDGMIRRLALRLVVPAALLLMAAGAGYLALVGTSWDLDQVPVANTAYSAGFVLLLLRLYPDFSWMSRHRVLDGLVSLVNARAMTIYLWGNTAIWAATPLLSASPLAQYYTDDARGDVLQYVTAWLLIGVCVLAVGWVEDVAARRRPRLLPWPTAAAAQDRRPAARV